MRDRQPDPKPLQPLHNAPSSEEQVLEDMREQIAEREKFFEAMTQAGGNKNYLETFKLKIEARRNHLTKLERNLQTAPGLRTTFGTCLS